MLRTFISDLPSSSSSITPTLINARSQEQHRTHLPSGTELLASAPLGHPNAPRSTLLRYESERKKTRKNSQRPSTPPLTYHLRYSPFDGSEESRARACRCRRIAVSPVLSVVAAGKCSVLIRCNGARPSRVSGCGCQQEISAAWLDLLNLSRSLVALLGMQPAGVEHLVDVDGGGVHEQRMTFNRSLRAQRWSAGLQALQIRAYVFEFNP